MRVVIFSLFYASVTDYVVWTEVLQNKDVCWMFLNAPNKN